VCRLLAGFGGFFWLRHQFPKNRAAQHSTQRTANATTHQHHQQQQQRQRQRQQDEAVNNLRDLLARAISSGDMRAAVAALEVLFKTTHRPGVELAVAAVAALWDRHEAALVLQSLLELAVHDKWWPRERRQELVLLHLGLLVRHGRLTDALTAATAVVHEDVHKDNPVLHAFIAMLCYLLTDTAAAAAAPPAPSCDSSGDEDDEDDDVEDEETQRLVADAEQHARRALELCGWRGLDECVFVLAVLLVRRGDKAGAAEVLRTAAERGGGLGAMRMRAEFLAVAQPRKFGEAFEAHLAWATADPTARPACDFVFRHMDDVVDVDVDVDIGSDVDDGGENKKIGADGIAEGTRGSYARIAQLAVEQLKCCPATAWRPWATLAVLAHRHADVLAALPSPPWGQNRWQRLHFAAVPDTVLSELCSAELLLAKAAAAELLFGRDDEHAQWWRIQACGRCGLNYTTVTVAEMLSLLPS